MEAQHKQLVAAITIGCDRTTAAAYIGLSPAELAELLTADADLARDVRRAEATAEINHLRNLHNATQEPKNWRASIWWLKSRQPERYDRKPHTVNDQELAEFVGRLMDALDDLVPQESRPELARRVEALLADAGD